MITPRFTNETLADLRRLGDPPADEVARSLWSMYGADGLDETQIVRRVVRAVAAGATSEHDAVLAWLRDRPPLPGWADPQAIAGGQRFFRAWPLPITTALFCAALPLAYAAPHGAAVLTATSQLRDRRLMTRRLAETGQMLFEVMDFSGTGADALQPGGQGYMAARGVRLLHAVVRQALRTRTDPPWPAEHGVPVNQEDLLGTLLAFTVGVLGGMERLGIPVPDEDAESYVHAWCVVGALLGIDASLLPLRLDEARELADTIAERQQRPSVEGSLLADGLLREMRLAMPAGCRDLPAALVHHLVPDAAEMLGVPPPAPLWRGLVEVTSSATRAAQRVPWLTPRVADRVAVVGRSMLRMYVDRELQPGGPAYRLDPDAVRQATGGGSWRRTQRRTERRGRRGDTVGVGPHVGPSRRAAHAALAHEVTPPIDIEDVRLIASEGYPLWEPVDVMVRRNCRVTLAYAELSRQLARLIAGADGLLDANWCTFATWSSRTVGTWIDDIPPDAGLASLADVTEATGRAGPVPGGVAGGPLAGIRPAQLTRRLAGRNDSAGLRTLAAANRTVFLEIGVAITTFLEQFPSPDAAVGLDGEARWRTCWKVVKSRIDEFEVLDPSWLLTPCPPPNDLRLGLRQYFEALRTGDQELRSQHVLAGNLLLAAYEQRRIDGYIWAALALFTERAMRRLIRDRTGAISGLRRWPSNAFAVMATRQMALELPNERLPVCQPIPSPPNPRDVWPGLATDADVVLPLLQALITRYQLAVGRWPDRGARNWTSFDQRMRTIGNLFRQRQRQADLFTDPFDPEETALLLGGEGTSRRGRYAAIVTP